MQVYSLFSLAGGALILNGLTFFIGLSTALLFMQVMQGMGIFNNETICQEYYC